MFDKRLETLGCDRNADESIERFAQDRAEYIAMASSKEYLGHPLEAEF